MRKNNFSIFGMLTLGLVFLVGCPNETPAEEAYTGPKTIKITGFNLVPTVWECTVRKSVGGDKIGRYGSGPTSVPSSVLSMGLIDMDTTESGTHPENGEQLWAGTGNYFISITADGSDYYFSDDGTNPTMFYIKDAVTTLDWTKFVQSM